MRISKLLALSTALIAGVGLMNAPSVRAADINSIVGDFGTVGQFEDDDIEWEINAAGGTEGILDEGDRLRGVVVFPEFVTFDGTTQLDLNGTDNSAFGAIFDIRVASKSPGAGGLFDFEFAPSADFEAEYGAGSMVAFFEDDEETTVGDIRNAGIAGDTDANRRAAAEGLITDGTLAFTAGKQGLPFEFWSAINANDNLALVEDGSPVNDFGNFNFLLSVLQSNLGNLQPTSLTSQTALGGSGSILGGDIDSNDATSTFFDVTSDAQVGLQQVTIPLPSTLTLLGLAFVALGFAGRRLKA